MIGRRAPGLVAVAGQVERQRQVAFTVQPTRHAVPGAAGAAEPVQQDDVLGHASRSYELRNRHLPAAARVRRTSSRAAACAGACTSPGSRCAPLVLALARELRPALLLPRRRALRGLLRARPGEGIGAAGGRHLHLGHGRRRAAAGRDRGARGARAAAAAHGRPAGGAARERRRTGDRPAEAVRRGGEVVLRGRARTAPGRRSCAGSGRSPAARTGPRSRAGPASVHLNFPLREPLRPRRGRCRWSDPTPRALTERPYVRAPPRHGVASSPVAMTSTRRSRELIAGARRGVLVAGRHERPHAARRAPRRRSPPRPAGRCWPTRCRAPAAARPPSPTTTRCCATSDSPATRTPTWSCAWATCRSPSPCGAGSRASTACAQVALDPEGAWQDPASVLTDSLALEPASALARLAGDAARGARRTGSPAGAARTSVPPRRSSACSRRRELSEPAVARRAGRAAAGGGDPVRRLLDARARHRDVLAGARRTPRACSATAAPTASTGRSRRVRGRGRRGRPGRAADRRRRARPRHRRPARRPAPRARS